MSQSPGEIGPSLGEFGPKRLAVCVKVYFKVGEFAEITEDAVRAGFRRPGLKLSTAKPHGFKNERVANTDGVSKFLKECWRRNTATQELAAALSYLTNPPSSKRRP